MAMMRYARAMITHPSVSPRTWNRTRQASQGAVRLNISDQAQEVLGEALDLSKWLLTHVTIVASVDTESPAGVTVGKVVVDGFGADRQYPDYRITQETEQYINGNNDAFERKALLKSYRTFVGGHNFCFPPGTEVWMADGTKKPIEDVVCGDLVLTADGSAGKVTQLFTREVDGDLTSILTNHSTKPLLCTGNHPLLRILEDGTEAWVRADSLCAGADAVAGKSPEGGRTTFTILSADRVPYTGTVYNFEVEDQHTYVVGQGVVAHNCEHVQILEESKGRILDAVPREVEGSVYIDILVATSRQHKDLIRDIETGKITTLSMGCFLPGTLVTMADGTERAIETLTGGGVVRTHLGRDREIQNLQIKLGSHEMVRIWTTEYKTIGTTVNHPFFVLRDGVLAEVRADRLMVGDQLTGTVASQVAALERFTYEGPVYDLEVEDDHSYLVEGVAVHNCQIDFSICTMCGNVASDEPQMCPHMQIKGSKYIDDKGVVRTIAELCGHHSVDPHGGIRFIEASWVGVPAFKGAVLRNIVEPTQLGGQISKSAERILSEPPTQWVDKGIPHTAKQKRAFDEFDEGGGEEPSEVPPAEEPKDPIKEFVNKVENDATQKVLTEIRRKLEPEMAGTLPETKPTENSPNLNDNLTKTGRYTEESVISSALRVAYLTSSDSVSFLRGVRAVDSMVGRRVASELYAAAAVVAPRTTEIPEYLKGCREKLGRLTPDDSYQLIRLAGLVWDWKSRHSAVKQ